MCYWICFGSKDLGDKDLAESDLVWGSRVCGQTVYKSVHGGAGVVGMLDGV
jgi:hypothetical protein